MHYILVVIVIDAYNDKLTVNNYPFLYSNYDTSHARHHDNRTVVINN